MMNLQVLQTYNSMRRRESPCLVGLMLYFGKFSFIKRCIDNIFVRKYQIADFEDNDFDAIVSRLFYVQDREDATWFMGL